MGLTLEPLHAIRARLRRQIVACVRYLQPHCTGGVQVRQHARKYIKGAAVLYHTHVLAPGPSTNLSRFAAGVHSGWPREIECRQVYPYIVCVTPRLTVPYVRQQHLVHAPGCMRRQREAAPRQSLKPEGAHMTPPPFACQGCLCSVRMLVSPEFIVCVVCLTRFRHILPPDINLSSFPSLHAKCQSSVYGKVRALRGPIA